MKITFNVDNSLFGRDVWVQAEGPGPRFSSTKKIKAESQVNDFYTAHQGIISPAGDWDIYVGIKKSQGKEYSKHKTIKVPNRPMVTDWVVTITITPSPIRLGFDITLTKF